MAGAAVAVTSNFKNSTMKVALGAACAVLGISGSAAQASEVDSALLFYHEANRVTALEGVVAVNHIFDDRRSGNLKFVFDTLTGASANGATPWRAPQTFTRPSGSGSYTTTAGDTPLDDTFTDARGALSAGLSQRLGRLNTITAGLYGSGEHDYFSLGGNLGLARDFFHRNTTLSVGVSASHDKITPEGGRPEPFASMLPSGTQPNRLAGDGTKNVTDFMFGVTQIIDRATLMQINYSTSLVHGYQTDPYKILSVVDGTSGAPSAYLYENRPDSRTKHILYTKLKHHLTHDIFDVSYRFMSDDWGIRSHTAEMHYRLAMNKDRFLQPHVRWYHQTAADFYQRYLIEGEGLPDFATADYRLGDFTAWTVGLEHGRPVGENTDLTMRLEYYVQDGAGPMNPVAGLAAEDLFPSVKAVYAQFAVRYRY